MSLVVLCAAVVSIYGPSARKEGVVVATSKNFKEEVIQADGPVAVQFFAPWCGHCKALKPAWKAATKALKGSVKLVVVDATSEGQLAAKYQGVSGTRACRTVLHESILRCFVRGLSSRALYCAPPSLTRSERIPEHQGFHGRRLEQAVAEHV